MTKTERPQTSLGFTTTDDPRDYRGILSARCDDCGTVVTRDGMVLRSHRRNCPVNPQPVYVPGVCDA